MPLMISMVMVGMVPFSLELMISMVVMAVVPLSLIMMSMVVMMSAPAMFLTSVLFMHAPALCKLPRLNLGKDHAQRDLPIVLHPWAHLLHHWGFGLIACRLDL